MRSLGFEITLLSNINVFIHYNIIELNFLIELNTNLIELNFLLDSNINFMITYPFLHIKIIKHFLYKMYILLQNNYVYILSREKYVKKEDNSIFVNLIFIERINWNIFVKL